MLARPACCPLPKAGEAHQSLRERDGTQVRLEAAVIANTPFLDVKPRRSRG